MDPPTATVGELRAWMNQNHLPDRWWVCNRIRIHGPMTLDAMEQQYLNANCKPYVVHTVYTEDHPWVEVIQDVGQLKKTNRFIAKKSELSALKKCWSRKGDGNRE